MLDIWSELSTFWHKFAVLHDKECTVPAFGNRDLGFCKNEASLGPFRSVKTVHNRKFLPFFAKSGHGLGRVVPFGFAVKGFMGGAAGMDAEKLAC